jgi:hypothetical protein
VHKKKIVSIKRIGFKVRKFQTGKFISWKVKEEIFRVSVIFGVYWPGTLKIADNLIKDFPLET